MRQLRTADEIVRVGALPAVTNGARVRRFRIVNANDFPDHVVCVTWDGTTEGTREYDVLKPWSLRRTPFDGQSRAGIGYTHTSNVRRTASDGSQSETQVIVPNYFATDELYAVKTDEGWVDINVDGRAWAKE